MAGKENIIFIIMDFCSFLKLFYITFLCIASLCDIWVVAEYWIISPEHFDIFLPLGSLQIPSLITEMCNSK